MTTNDDYRTGQWEYKGHTCNVWDEVEFDEDNIKRWHEVTTPDGKHLFADISPYERRRRAVELWIDAGYPNRISCGPLHVEDLESIIKTKLESCRQALRAENISYGELAELQALAAYIEPGDVELLEPAGVPEFPETDTP